MSKPTDPSAPRGYNIGDELIVPAVSEATKQAARLTVVERVAAGDVAEVLAMLGLDGAA